MKFLNDLRANFGKPAFAIEGVPSVDRPAPGATDPE
jgi:hypothetical protein